MLIILLALFEEAIARFLPARNVEALALWVDFCDRHDREHHRSRMSHGIAARIHLSTSGAWPMCEVDACKEGRRAIGGSARWRRIAGKVQTIFATHQAGTSWPSEYLVSTEARIMSNAFDGAVAPRWNGRNTTSPRLTDMPLSAQTPLTRA